jgi:hypothetical protein
MLPAGSPWMQPFLVPEYLTCRLPAIQGEHCDSTTGFLHFIRDHIAMNIHGGSAVGMSHQLLLNCNWSPHRVQPRSVRVPERVSPKSAESSVNRCRVVLPPYLIV